MKVVEIFRSLQGEGANTGRLATFIRLADCNLDCWFCDTHWEEGLEMTLEEIDEKVEDLGCYFLIWTGGEPTLQLSESVVSYFKNKGYTQAIETNGTHLPPEGIDYISCSPKVSARTLRQIYGEKVINEIRYPLGNGTPLPPKIEELPMALNYFVSPLFLGEEGERMEYSKENLALCIDFIEQDPRWRLSLQTHKLINIQ